MRTRAILLSLPLLLAACQGQGGGDAEATAVPREAAGKRAAEVQRAQADVAAAVVFTGRHVAGEAQAAEAPEESEPDSGDVGFEDDSDW